MTYSSDVMTLAAHLRDAGAPRPGDPFSAEFHARELIATDTVDMWLLSMGIDPLIPFDEADQQIASWTVDL